MKTYIAILILIFGMTLGAGLAWAMTPMLLCYMSATGVCTNVTISTPLPTVSN